MLSRHTPCPSPPQAGPTDHLELLLHHDRWTRGPHCDSGSFPRLLKQLVLATTEDAQLLVNDLHPLVSREDDTLNGPQPKQSSTTLIEEMVHPQRRQLPRTVQWHKATLLCQSRTILFSVNCVTIVPAGTFLICMSTSAIGSEVITPANGIQVLAGAM